MHVHHCTAAISDICAAEVANNLCLLGNNMSVTVYYFYTFSTHVQ